jgi:NADH:ubiquinone reductase (H+-translocating)
MEKGKDIIIAGGGFGGLQFARKLNKSPFRILLIDRLNYHQFQPLFYQIASARLEPSNISFPFRKIFQRSPNIDFLLADVIRTEPEYNKLITSAGEFHYDYLVIATGCNTNYFNNTEIRQNTMAMKTTMEALEIRNNILLGFERLKSAKMEDNEALLNIVIVGAGPTGVELAGAFAEMRNNILPKDYPGTDFSNLNIILLDGSPYTLSSMSAHSKKASMKFLKQLGVKILTNVFVTAYDGTNVNLSNGTKIVSRNVIWAAGVTGNLLEGIDNECITKSNRYITDRFNRIKLYDNIYAIGDVAYMETPLYPSGHPQVANVAINQGKNLAGNLKAILENKPMKEYEYKDLASMATIGKHRAVVDLPFISFSGYLAWLFWMFLHLMLILSVRNKIMIFINWAWFYFTKDTSLRIILREAREKEK